MATNLVALATLVATVPDVDAARTLEQATVATRMTAAAAIVAAGVGGRVGDGPVLGAEAVAQASAYESIDADTHVLDGLAHHVFNTLSAPTPGAPVSISVSRDKIDLMNRVPELLDAEVTWRTRAATDATLATALGYWDRATTVNPNDPLSQKIFGIIRNAAIADDTLIGRIVEECKDERAGPTSTKLEDAGLSDATVDDVRTVLASTTTASAGGAA